MNLNQFDDMMGKSGIIHLDSGIWHWTLQGDHRGHTVRFHTSERCNDEIQVWTDRPELGPEEAGALVAEAVLRVWTDGFGRQWEITVEPPVRWSSESDPVEWLQFASGNLMHRVEAPRGRRLCDLSGSALAHLLSREENAGLSLGA